MFSINDRIYPQTVHAWSQDKGTLRAAVTYSPLGDSYAPGVVESAGHILWIRGQKEVIKTAIKMNSMDNMAVRIILFFPKLNISPIMSIRIADIKNLRFLETRFYI